MSDGPDHRVARDLEDQRPFPGAAADALAERGQFRRWSRVEPNDRQGEIGLGHHADVARRRGIPACAAHVTPKVSIEPRQPGNDRIAVGIDSGLNRTVRYQAFLDEGFQNLLATASSSSSSDNTSRPRILTWTSLVPRPSRSGLCRPSAQ